MPKALILNGMAYLAPLGRFGHALILYQLSKTCQPLAEHHKEPRRV